MHNIQMNSGLPSADPAPGFDDPLGMLFACHRRIERQLATLVRLSQHVLSNGCDDEARSAARAILKYFDGAAPNHHADEEHSVFPRLLALRPEGAYRLVATLHDEHATLAEHWNRLRPLLSGIASGSAALLPSADVAALCAVYVAHIAREDGELIPLAKAKLDAAALLAIGREMADRRGVDPTAPHLRAGGAAPGDAMGSLP
jgi:pyridoxamine 5'-phosphate oxidase